MGNKAKGIFAALAVFMAIAASTLALAQKPAAPLPKPIRPVFLSSKASEYFFGTSIRIFPDPARNLTFSQALTRFKAGQGISGGEQIFIGYSPAAYWLLFDVYNRNPAKSQWMLDLGNRMTGTIGTPDKIQVFTDAAPTESLLTDGRAVDNKRHIPGQQHNAAPLTFEPGQTRTVGIYIVPSPGIPYALHPALREPATFSRLHDQQVMERNVMGGMAALVVIAFLLMLAISRHTIPGLLAVYVGANYGLFVAGDEMLPLGNNTAATLMHLLAVLAAFSGISLARQVLFEGDDQNRQRLVLTGLNGFVILLGVISAFTDWGREFTHAILIRFMPLVLPAVIMVLGIIAIMRSTRPQALPFTFAWTILLIGALVTASTASGLLGYTAGGINCYWLVFILHFSILSFASIRYMTSAREMQREEIARRRRRSEEEAERRKTKELADQTRLLGVLQREKELMADVRSREAERIQALRRAKEVADQANKSKSDFLAVISHEIRTPMTGIMGMIRLLLDTHLDQRQREYARTVQYSSEALLTLLNDILDFSKVEEGKMTLENLDFDLGKVVESVILLMSGRAEEKKIGLRAEIDPETPLALRGDPTRLRQILLNLISNAIKFTDHGEVTVTVKVHDKSAKKPRIYFAVKDTGIGISEEAQKKLFTPYSQADASISRNFGGTGLGLAICKRLIEAMGSAIQLHSKPGEGTVFYFIIALDYGSGDAQEGALAKGDIRPLKILVVDDNIINQRVVSGLLEKDGHRIVTVGSAELALNEIKSLTFDVILLDMEMPHIDGVQAAKMIRELPDPEKSKVRIIAMTANTRREDVQRCRDAGMDDYISKPVSPENLRRLLIQVARKIDPAVPAGPDLARENPGPPVSLTPMQMAEQQKLFNLETLGGLRDSLGKDQMSEMMEGLYQKAEELIAAAEKAVADNDGKKLGQRGHDIKGMTANFGLTALSDLAGRLERQSKENFSLDILAEVVKKLRPTYYDTRSAVDKWMKGG